MSQRLGARKKRQRGLLQYQIALRERMDLVSNMITSNTGQAVERVTYGALKVYPDEKFWTDTRPTPAPGSKIEGDSK